MNLNSLLNHICSPSKNTKNNIENMEFNKSVINNTKVSVKGKRSLTSNTSLSTHSGYSLANPKHYIQFKHNSVSSTCTCTTNSLRNTPAEFKMSEIPHDSRNTGECNKNINLTSPGSEFSGIIGKKSETGIETEREESTEEERTTTDIKMCTIAHPFERNSTTGGKKLGRIITTTTTFGKVRRPKVGVKEESKENVPVEDSDAHIPSAGFNKSKSHKGVGLPHNRISSSPAVQPSIYIYIYILY